MNAKQEATFKALPWIGARAAELPNGLVIVAHPDHTPVVIDKEGWAEAVAALVPGAKVTVTVGPLYYG